MRSAIILAGAVLLLSEASSAEEKIPEWEKISSADGIIVYQKASDKPTISFRADATVPAAISDIFAVMKNEALTHEWIPYVTQKKIFRVINEDERIAYTHVGMPWPLTDRYVISHEIALRQSNGAVEIRMKSVAYPDYLEKESVLGQLNYSTFFLEPIGPTTTFVKIEVNTDPKGMIPKWLVNLTQRSWPRDVFNGLMAQLEKQGKLRHPEKGT